MRFAHEAHVMPVIGSSTWLTVASHLLVNATVCTRPVVLELEEQPVAAGGRELGLERDGRSPRRVDVQERQVALAQRDEVAAGAEVRLGRDRLAVAGDA